jgi:hypothetical protein
MGRSLVACFAHRLRELFSQRIFGRAVRGTSSTLTLAAVDTAFDESSPDTRSIRWMNPPALARETEGVEPASNSRLATKV